MLYIALIFCAFVVILFDIVVIVGASCFFVLVVDVLVVSNVPKITK